MRKSNLRTRNFRSDSRPHALRLANFRKQMADDFARGEKLVYLRKSRRLTQATLAFKTGFSEKTIRSWEKDGAIKWPNAKRIAKFLEVDPESIVTRDLRPPVEQEDIERMQEQLNELLARSAEAPERAASAARQAKKKSRPKSPSKQSPKAKKRRAS